MSRPADTDRMLAMGVAESVFHLSGKLPVRPRAPWGAICGWLLVVAIMGAVLALVAQQ